MFVVFEICDRLYYTDNDSGFANEVLDYLIVNR